MLGKSAYVCVWKNERIGWDIGLKSKYQSYQLDWYNNNNKKNNLHMTRFLFS